MDNKVIYSITDHTCIRLYYISLHSYNFDVAL